jgi:tRNA pseudouridine38-40 synthase
MQRYALKFGYSGRNFHGYQRQPSARTVEGDIIRAMKKVGIIRDFRRAGFSSASRTDAGVSAIGNALAVNTGFRKGEIMPALNANLDGIWFWGIAQVDRDFNPRHAEKRMYRYHLPVDGRDIPALKRAGRVFVGEHDFSGFCYAVKGKDTVRRVDSVTVSRRGNLITIDVEAPNFLWGMVRMIVAAMIKAESGEIGIENIKTALRGGRKRDFGVALPEHLVLLDVAYGFEFKTQFLAGGNAGRKVLKSLKEKEHAAGVKMCFYSAMAEKFSR